MTRHSDEEQTYLLAVHKHTPSRAKRAVDVRAYALEMRADIRSALVHDGNAVAIESVLLRKWEPRHVEHLDEVGDVVCAQEGGVLHC